MYLTSSATAPLNKEYVEIESPLWYVSPIIFSLGVSFLNPHSTFVYFAEDVRATYVELLVYVGSIPTEHLDTFDERLKASLTRIADEGIDMKRMAMVIDRQVRQVSAVILSPYDLHSVCFL